MEASAWSSGSGTFGIRVGIPNRDQHFDRSWTQIVVEIDGQAHTFTLTPGFWNKCPEFRDSGGTVIRDWLERHHTLDWPTGEPPRFQLLPLGGNRFRLLAEAGITRERIDELLHFLPVLSNPGPDTEPEWHGLDQKSADGVFTMPYPTYSPAVEEFFALAGQEWWCDYGYVPEEAGELIRSDAAIASASLAQVKAMLTFCVRGERFCDGHWGGMIREGRIGAILRRLSQLRDTVR